MNTTIKNIELILTSEYSTKSYVEFVQNVFSSMRLIAHNNYRKEFSNFSSHIMGSTHIGEYITSDNKKVAIFSVELKNAQYVQNSRSTQRSYAKKLIEAGNCDAALVAFYTTGDVKWRISFVRLDYEMKIEHGKLKTSENITPAKRYSFLVGKDEPCHTAIDRFQQFIVSGVKHSLDEIEEAFSVERVTKEFFELYCEKFYQLQEYLDSNEDFVEESKRCGFTSEQFAKKLMGQIVFLYFLQKKGWLGVNVWPQTLTEKEYKNLFFVTGAQGRIIKEHLDKIYVPAEDGSYRLLSRALDEIPDEDEEVIANHITQILVNGNEESRRKVKTWGAGSKKFLRTIFEFSQKHKGHFYEYYLEPLFYNTLNKNRGNMGYCPFLHCRVPFLSGGLFDPLDGYDWRSNHFDIPDKIFSNKKDENDRTADGILDIFDRYNFTMSEDEPLEREVAIDPEMLGKIFENLLEVRDRKSKGAFYTPREIVHYMCQESLVNYLVRKTGISETALRDFILYGDFMKDEDTDAEKRKGNGGMYISEELFKVGEDGTIVVNRLIDVDNALATVRVADPAVGSGAFPLGMVNEIVRARQNITAYISIGMNSNSKRLMYKNERSPYMLKYQTIRDSIFAVDIEPSAVDIAQLRLWLSLVIDDEVTPDAANDFEGHRNPLPLPNLECNIICGNSLIDEYKGTRLIEPSKIISSGSNEQLSIYASDFDMILSKLLDAQDDLFRCDEPKKKEQLKSTIKTLKGMIVRDKFDDDGFEEYQHACNQSSAPLILWHLEFARVFRDNGGFDIVIGNPPYIGESGHKEIFRPVAETNFGKRFYKGKMDFFYFFFHKALDLLCNRGFCGLITTNYYLTADGAKNLRSDFRDRANITRMLNFNELKIFQTALGQHNIITFLTKEPQQMVKCCLTSRKGNANSDIINTIVQWRDSETTYFTISAEGLYDENGNIAYHEPDAILEKMRAKKNYVFDKKDIGGGIDILQESVVDRHLEVDPTLTVGKGIFAVESDEIDSLGFSDEEMTILKPYFTSEQIRRYAIVAPNHRWILYTDKKVCENIDAYPNVKKHFDQYTKIVTSDNKPYGLHRPRVESQFIGTKLLSLRMTKEPCFTLAECDTYVTRAYLTVKLEGLNYKFAVGLFNSHLFYYWLFHVGKRKGKQLQVDQAQLMELPVFKPSEDVQEAVAKIIDSIIEHVKNQEEYDELETAINKYVYEIYGLSPDEVNKVESFVERIRNS